MAIYAGIFWEQPRSNKVQICLDPGSTDHIPTEKQPVFLKKNVYVHYLVILFMGFPVTVSDAM